MKKSLLYLFLLLVLLRAEEDYHTTPEEIDKEVGTFLKFLINI